MKIMFLKMTFFGKSVLPGDIIEVSEADGKRLVAKGIAEIVFEEVAEEEVVEPTVSFDQMSTKDLFALCKERGLELEKNMINGKTADEKKEYLLSVLNQAEG